MNDREFKRAQLLCQRLLKVDLVPSDSHDEGAGYMTKDNYFYFSPCEDDFVMSEPTLRGPAAPTDRPRWRIEAVRVIQAASYWEPEDADLCEVCERQDGLWDAIKAAARAQYDWEIANIAESVFWETDKDFRDVEESY